MSEAKYSCDLLSGTVYEHHDGFRLLCRAVFPDDATRIVSALNEVDELREQVRLYELAAERGWVVIKRGAAYSAGEAREIFCDFSSNGPTPTAAIAAAEKKGEAMSMHSTARDYGVDLYEHESEPSESERCWFVESCYGGKCEGWFTAPPLGVGGWLTENPLEAKRYTRAEAEAVARALTYFHSPFTWSEWKATEHVFVGRQ